jgi:signal transduction histidine kinase
VPKKKTPAPAVQPGPAGTLDFLAGGGEMGARMRAFDWRRTPLGPPGNWPQSLKTIVRVLLDSRYAMWMLWGPEFTFFCNDAYLPTVGVKRDWVLGARSDRVWEEIWPDIGPRIGQVLKRGEATWDEALQLFLERQGFPEETYHTFSYSPVYDDANHIAGMLCVVTEVTTRVIGERRLRLLRDLATRPAGVERVEETCQRLCEVLRQYPCDLPFAALYLQDGARGGLRWVAGTRALPPALAPPVLDSSAPGVSAAVSTEQPQLLTELPRRAPPVHAGSWPDAVQQAMVLPLKSGQEGLDGLLIAGLSPRRPLDEDYRAFVALLATQVAAAVRDAQTYEAERRRAESLAELDRAKTTFFSNVSHEFRTPLTLMLGPTEAALASPERALRGEELERLHRSELRLLRLVNSLLEFSRIEAGRAQASYVATDLAALTRDLASTFRSAIERAGLEFRVECPPLPQPLHVDREMWEKIVLNLLSNAFKFTLQGGIAVRLTDAGEEVILEVSDSGVGIPAEEMPRLFERFHRIEGTQGRTHEGSGIGLALVHELVKLHGGRIAVTSEVERGSCFRIHIRHGTRHLPAERLRERGTPHLAAAASQAFVQEAERWLPEQPAAANERLGAADASAGGLEQRFAATFGARILLADDNADMRAYVRDLLAPLYMVETVNDGAQALAAARSHRPDLILADVMMPRLDGFGLLQQLRADSALQDVPFIMLSARAGQESRIEGLDAGADDYLVKPFAARELIARVGSMLERRTARERFDRRTVQLVTLLRNAPLGVYLVDEQLKVRDANPMARELFAPIADPIGRDLSELAPLIWPEQQAQAALQRFRTVLASGADFDGPAPLERQLAGGEKRYYEWQLNRVPLIDGGYGVVCYLRDISAYVSTRLKLEEGDRRKDEFLATLSHELRNPLAPIRNAAELMAAPNLSDDKLLWARRVIQRQVKHMAWLLDDLLDVARITQGKLQLKRELVTLPGIVDTAVETARPLLESRSHQLVVKLPAERVVLDADALRVSQILANLLTNAAKYTDPGGRIELRAETEGEFLRLAVRDNGIGISPQALPELFTLFSQIESSAARSEGGLGIGLALVKGLVELHGGRVCASSDGPGLGSEFTVHLPLVPPALAGVKLAPDKAQGRAIGRRVLIADDNRDAADSLATLLQLAGHEVRVAYGGEATLSLAQAFRPEFAVLDIGMPDLNGYRVAEALRAESWGASPYLIALTGWGQDEDKRKAFAAGFDAHLTKPIELEQLNRLLESRRQGARASALRR